MHLREAQNVIVGRAVNEAARALPVIERTRQAASKVTPVATPQSDVLRCGMQTIGEAVLGE